MYLLQELELVFKKYKKLPDNECTLDKNLIAFLENCIKAYDEIQRITIEWHHKKKEA